MLRKQVEDKQQELEQLQKQLIQQKEEYENKLEQQLKKRDDDAKLLQKTEDGWKDRLKKTQIDLNNETSLKMDIINSLDLANKEIERLNKALKQQQEDTDHELQEYRKKMERQKEDYFKQLEETRKAQEKIEEENRELHRKFLNSNSHELMLEDKSKTLEEKLKAIQQRYEDRLKINEEEIQKLRKESSTFRHENELLRSENSDLDFRVKRAEYNEKVLQERLSKTNEDYATLLTKVDQFDSKIADLREEIKILTVEKNDAEDLVTQKRTKLALAESRIQELEEELKDKDSECKNRLKAYERMKKENEEFKRKTDESERKLYKVKNDTVKTLKRNIISKQQDINIFKQKVKGSEIMIHTKDKQIKFLTKKVKRLEQILKIHA